MDPCALVDLGRLSEFGVASLDVPQLMNGCAAQVNTVDGSARLALTFQEPSTSEIGAVEQFGGVQVRHQHVVPGDFGSRCRNVLWLTDRTRILVEVLSSNVGVDRCRLADAAAYIAIDLLGKHGVTYQPNRSARWPNAASDACALVTNAELASIAGTNPAIRTPGFANWQCTWGTDSAGAALSLRIDGATTESYGQSTDIAGHRAWLNPVPGPRYSHCDATVVSHQASVATDNTELVQVKVSGLKTDPNLCNRASNLAKAALARLPS